MTLNKQTRQDSFEGLYYNPSEVFSYGRPLNYLIGGRGIGKTYGMKAFCIRKFLKKGKKFVWLRRYEQELLKMESFFDKVKQDFPDVQFEVAKNKIWYFKINNKIAGYGMEMSKWNTYKGLEFDDVETIVLDEFIIENRLYRYLSNEPEPLLNMADTIWRNLDNPSARIVCLGNSDDLSNVYFTYFKIPPDIPFGITIHHNGMIAVERNHDKEFATARRERTLMGKLTDGTNYATMAIDNTSKGITDNFVEKKSPYSEMVCILVIKGREFGVWRDYTEGKFYISHKLNPNYRIKYVMSMDDMKPNLQLVTNWKKEFHLSEIIKAMKNGYLFYEDLQLRNIMLELFSSMPL